MAKVYEATKQAGWAEWKTYTSSQEALSVTGRKAAAIPTDAYPIPEMMNHIEIRFKATGAENVDGTVHVYGARGTSDDICHIGDLVITAGQQLATDNNRYVDTMIPTDRWITEMYTIDASANNGMSRCVFDTAGYGLVFFRIEFTDSTSWIIEITGFN